MAPAACLPGLTLLRRLDAREADDRLPNASPSAATRGTDFLADASPKLEVTRDSKRDAMAPPKKASAAQVRNIETRYGKADVRMVTLITASGIAKHTEVVAMLKAGLAWPTAAAHRVIDPGPPTRHRPQTQRRPTLDASPPGRRAGLRQLPTAHEGDRGLWPGRGHPWPKEGIPEHRPQKQFRHGPAERRRPLEWA